VQVFVALLRTVQPDVRRPLVREALDLLTPALPTRLAPGARIDLKRNISHSVCRTERTTSNMHACTASGCDKLRLFGVCNHEQLCRLTGMLSLASVIPPLLQFNSAVLSIQILVWQHAAERGQHPKWSLYVRKVSGEEGGSLPHLVHIWAAIVRHADMFTSSRAAFTPQMVSSLQRLGALLSSETLILLQCASVRPLMAPVATLHCQTPWLPVGITAVVDYRGSPA